MARRPAVKKQKVYKADYGDATPEQVTLALLRHRPNASEAVKKRLPPQIQADEDSGGAVKSAI